MIRLSQLLYGTVVLMLVMVGLSTYMSSAVSEYGLSDYNDTDFSTYDRLNELSGTLEEFETESINGTITEDNRNDVLGALFSNAYTSAQTVKQSSAVISSSIDDGVDQLPMAYGFKQTLKSAVGLLLVILVSVAVLLHFIIKSERV